MDINRTLRLSAEQYYRDVLPKRQIYLHHTVGGSAKSTFDYWQASAERIGTAYIVERNGEIFEVFDPSFWAHHLGLKLAANTVANKQSIGIELASEGALRSGDELNNVRQSKGLPQRFDPEWLYAFDVDPDVNRVPDEWFSRARKLYHMIHDREKYFDWGLQFRGYHYFDLYDEAQAVAAMGLVDELCERFRIPKRLIQNSDKLAFDESLVLGFDGVLTHCNVRIDKSDLSPAWNWDAFANRLGA